jgi:hypothetical protein
LRRESNHKKKGSIVANAKKKKEPDDKIKFIAGAVGGGFGALIAGPLGAAVGAGITHWVTSELMKEGM